jgi:hypothetical protein
MPRIAVCLTAARCCMAAANSLRSGCGSCVCVLCGAMVVLW